MIEQAVPHFRVLEKEGSGRMGIARGAEDTQPKRAVALEFLPEELSWYRHASKRFEQEAQAQQLALTGRNLPAGLIPPLKALNVGDADGENRRTCRATWT